MSKKLWAGRTSGETSRLADDFNSSIAVDCRMFREDIHGSMAHASMLAVQGIIPQADANAILAGLEGILADLESGKLQLDPTSEDIHMFVEQVLTERIGEAGKKLHTARSRNDQVALDLRLTLRGECEKIGEKLKSLAGALIEKAEQYAGTVMPGYTHLQRAQPITFGHHLMAYVMMLLRDLDRLKDAAKRMNICPIGSCALAGTTYPVDRAYEAQKLGFDEITRNSLDGVSDRDFVVEILSALALVMLHLSRLSEEIVLWSSWEFRFVELSDAYTTGSSIMPQKKNSDMAELIRGKTGRVYGDLVALLTTMKGLPLAYNKDMQEDKKSVFDACDTAANCLDVMTGMISTLKANEAEMRKAAGAGFLNATDLADYLVGKGLPFRTAYKLSGELVAYCLKAGTILETLPLEDYRKFSPVFDEDVYKAVDLDACVNRRACVGGTSEKSVRDQIVWAKEKLNAL